MICPGCGQSFEPAIELRGLTVHPYPCDTSIVLATGVRASAADTATLADDELAQLRKARNRPKRAKP